VIYFDLFSTANKSDSQEELLSS